MSMGGEERDLNRVRLTSLVESQEAEPGLIEGVNDHQVRSIHMPPVGAEKSSEKSLLIVDEKYLTETLRIIFQIVGYRGDTAHNGIQALKKSLDKPYDLVIMEANLSDAGGFEMAQIIKNMSRKTKVVLMTGDEYWEETLRGAPREIDDVLLKPFAPEELVNTVRRILEPRPEAKAPKLPLA